MVVGRENEAAFPEGLILEDKDCFFHRDLGMLLLMFERAVPRNSFGTDSSMMTLDHDASLSVPKSLFARSLQRRASAPPDLNTGALQVRTFLCDDFSVQVQVRCCAHGEGSLYALKKMAMPLHVMNPSLRCEQRRGEAKLVLLCYKQTI